MLAEKMQEVKGSLLKEVGSFSPTSVGEANLYDLGGNVAEWFDDGERQGCMAMARLIFVILPMNQLQHLVKVRVFESSKNCECENGGRCGF